MSESNITTVQGRAIPLRGNDIDTDRIIPARYLRCVSFDGLGAYAFEDDRQQNPDHVFNQEKYQGAAVLLAGRNFGCGSSREHAPQSLNRWGIQGVVAPSFAEIFFGNCTAMGIPCFPVTDDELEQLYQAVEADPQVEVTMDVASKTITVGDLSITAEVPAGVQDALLNGTWNATQVLLEADAEISVVAAALPYMNGFV